METREPQLDSRDPVQVLASLDPREIQRRLELLERERRALLALLRAARAAHPESQSQVRQGVSRAAG